MNDNILTINNKTLDGSFALISGNDNIELLKELCEDLGEFHAPGKMIWQVQNLHVYEKHFDLVV